MGLERLPNNYQVFNAPQEGVPECSPHINYNRDIRNFGILRDTETYYTNEIGDEHYPFD